MIITFYTRSKLIFYESVHKLSYSSNEPKSRIFRICYKLDGFDFNLDSESKF